MPQDDRTSQASKPPKSKRISIPRQSEGEVCQLFHNNSFKSDIDVDGSSLPPAIKYINHHCILN